VDSRIAIRGGENVVRSVTTRALREVRVLPDGHPPVQNIDLAHVLVTLDTVDRCDGGAVRADGSPVELLHRQVLMTIRAIKGLVNGVREEFLRRARKFAGGLFAVAVGTGFWWGVLGRSIWCKAQADYEQSNDNDH